MDYLKLKDDQTGPTVKLALFGDDAMKDFKIGDVLRVTYAYTRRDSSKLSTQHPTQIEIFFHPISAVLLYSSHISHAIF